MKAGDGLQEHGMNKRESRDENLRIVIDPDKCTLSRECMRVCPHDAISVKGGSATINPDKCDLDGICIPACPNGAIHFVNS